MTQKEALDILKMGENVFLTGPAGSGKTYILNKYISYLKKRGVGVAVTASTGIAATHIGGMTIHSWTGMGIKDEITDADLEWMLSKPRLKSRFKKTSVLVIDEVSMLHHFRLDMADKICRAFKDHFRPFGGMQVVMSGDFYQLPPVSSGGEEAYFIDKSTVWRDMNLKVCYLSEQYRQSEDNPLLAILNEMRAGRVSERSRALLREKIKIAGRLSGSDGEAKIGNFRVGQSVSAKLHTHNIAVDTINKRELDKINSPERAFYMSARGSVALTDGLKRGCLAPEKLTLKKGALVMFVKNNFEEGYVNGTSGRVEEFDGDGAPVIKTYSGKTVAVKPADWTIEENGKIKASITQLPLRLAWAITVHKSQGMSLDAAEIDLSTAFVEGMGYVALSRLRSLEGMILWGLNEKALVSKDEALALDCELRKLSRVAEDELHAINEKEKEQKQKEFIRHEGGRWKPFKNVSSAKSLTTYEKTAELLAARLSLDKIARVRGMVPETIIGHIEKLKEKNKNLNISHLRPRDKNRLARIHSAFARTGDTKLSPIKNILGAGFSYDEIRLARLFLD